MAETIDCMVNDSKIPMADVGKVLGITSRADYKVYTRAMQAVLGHFGFTLSQDPTLHRPRPYLLQSDLNKLLKKTGNPYVAVGGQTKPHGAFAKFRQGEKNKVDKIMRVVGNLFDIQREIAGPSMYDIIVINNVPENVADNLVPTPVVNLILEHQYLEPISEAYREIRR